MAEVLIVLTDRGIGAPFGFDVPKKSDVDCVNVSERLRAAGSMFGIVWAGAPAQLFYGRQRRRMHVDNLGYNGEVEILTVVNMWDKADWSRGF